MSKKSEMILAESKEIVKMKVCNKCKVTDPAKCVAHGTCDVYIEAMYEYLTSRLSKKDKYLAALEKLSKEKNVFLQLESQNRGSGSPSISARYSGDDMSSRRTGGSRGFRTIENALNWILYGLEEK